MRLGHIGDQAFGLAITDLIQALYPHLHVGPASVRTVLSLARVWSLIVTIQQLRDEIKRKDVIAKM